MCTWKMNALKLSTEFFDHSAGAQYSKLHMLQNNLNILTINKCLCVARDFAYQAGVNHLGGEDCCGGKCNC